MASKRLNFFQTVDDMIAVEKFLKENGCLLVGDDTKNIEAPSTDNGLLPIEKPYTVFLTNDRYNSKTFINYLHGHNFRHLDTCRSYVLEFILGGLRSSDKKLDRSAFHYTHKYYEGDTLIAKEEAFVKWCDNIMRDFKKQFLKKAAFTPITFFTDNAHKWHELHSARLEHHESILVADNIETIDYLQGLDFNTPLDNAAFLEIQKSFDCNFPDDYLEFMQKANGGTGIILDGIYVDLWSLESLKELNDGYEVEVYWPQLLFIGSSGGGFAYAIKKQEGSFVALGFLDTEEEYWINAGNSFKEFLVYLSEPRMDDDTCT